MKYNTEDGILDMQKIKHLTSMSVNRLLEYDKEEIAEHYEELVTIFCFLNEQVAEKVDNLTKSYYD